MLLPVTDALNGNSPASPISIAATTAGALFTPPTQTATGSFAAGGAPVPAADTINAIILQGDATSPVYVLLGPGTVSATNYHFILNANSFPRKK